MAQTNIFWRYDWDTSTDLQDIATVIAALVSNTSQMTAINEAGGVKCWIMPEVHPSSSEWRIYRADMPITCKSVAVMFAYGVYEDIPAGAETAWIEVNNVQYQIYTNTIGTGEVTLGIYNGYQDSTPLLQFKANEFKGVAEFDLSAFAQARFETDMQNTYGSDLAIDEPYLYAKFYIGKYSNKIAERYIFVRGVTEGMRADDLYLNVHGIVLLSEGTITKTTDGRGNKYVSVFIPDVQNTYSVTLHNSVQSLYSGRVYNLMVDSQTDANNINALLETLFWGKTVKYNALPKCNHLIVRWINADGGLDSFGFPHNQQEQRQVKTSQIASQIHREGKRLNRAELHPYGIDQTHLMRCGVDNLTDKQYEFLLDLVFSPYIEIEFQPLHTYEDVWERVVVNKFDITQNTDAPTKRFEIEFALPELNTQF